MEHGSTKPKLVMYGCGGHGKVVADIALSRGLAVAGFVDDGAPEGSRVLGLPVLGGAGWLEAHHSEIGVALAIGEKHARHRVYQMCNTLRVTLVTLIHPSATVAASARIGAGVVIMANAVVNPDARIGDGAIINSGAIVEHDCEVGAFAHLAPNATLGGAVRIGALAHVGLGACVLPGLTVGQDAMVGAGAVVVTEVPPGVVVVGVPARLHRSSRR